MLRHQRDVLRSGQVGEKAAILDHIAQTTAYLLQRGGRHRGVLEGDTAGRRL